jgi:hypothetical protein
VELDLNFRPDWPLRQGDLLGWVGWEERPPLDRFGLVITADCDIAQGRPDQELVYLRVITVWDYLNIFWSRQKLSLLWERSITELATRTNSLRRAADSTATEISASAIITWLKTAETAKIVASLPTPTADAQQKLARAVERAKKLLHVSDMRTSCSPLAVERI